MKVKLLTTAISYSMLSESAMPYVDYTTRKNQKQNIRTELLVLHPSLIPRYRTIQKGITKALLILRCAVEACIFDTNS